MSEIAGRMSIQEGAKYLEKTYGGRGVLLAGVPGVEKGNIVILGGGNVGTNACKVAVGMGANVTVLDVNASRLAYLDDIFPRQITTLYATRDNIQKALTQADLVIGAVLLPGRTTPKLVRREDLKRMKPGAVIVDVAVDQGGCVETSHPTTHDDPVFYVDGIVHYCVANMPGAVARTSTLALVNATTPYGLELAGKGVEAACRADKGLLAGLNCYGGKCTFPGVAEALGLEYVDPATLI
jgi:alanine dehydrogenase